MIRRREFDYRTAHADIQPGDTAYEIVGPSYGGDPRIVPRKVLGKSEAGRLAVEHDYSRGPSYRNLQYYPNVLAARGALVKLYGDKVATLTQNLAQAKQELAWATQIQDGDPATWRYED